MQTSKTGIIKEYCFLFGGAIYNAMLQRGTIASEMLFIYTDHPSEDGQALGSITQVTDNTGNLLAEYSYDAWGRMRNPETWETIINNQLSIINSRGYTGHEMLPLFGLINMNGRLYDPVLGRMLSPDNYIQAPDFTQNFNRYSYVLNNPLKYTDPDGEWLHIVIGAVVGGVSNWLIHGHKFTWEGLGYFVIGAGIGALTAATGGLTAGATQALGAIPGAFVGAAVGAATGGATSVLQGGLNNLVGGNDFWSTWQSDLKSGAITGAIGGAIGGGIAGYKRAAAEGANRWTGKGYRKTYWEWHAPLKLGVPLNPDSEGYCYAYEGEYADFGHLNRKHGEFITAAGNKKGADMITIWDNMNTEGKYRVTGADASVIEKYNNVNWESLGRYELTNSKKEIGFAIKTMSNTGGHAVHLTGIEYVEKLKIFGGGTKNVLLFDYWDPSKGFLEKQSIEILQIIIRTYK